jgi:hypothetical protein
VGLVCGLFYEALSVAKYITYKGRMVDERELEFSWRKSKENLEKPEQEYLEFRLRAHLEYSSDPLPHVPILSAPDCGTREK